jgi:hypothetical protein
MCTDAVLVVEGLNCLCAGSLRRRGSSCAHVYAVSWYQQSVVSWPGWPEMQQFVVALQFASNAWIPCLHLSSNAIVRVLLGRQTALSQD